MQSEYERIQRQAATWDTIAGQAITIQEVSAIVANENALIDIISIVYRYGFAKGQQTAKQTMKTKKALCAG